MGSPHYTAARRRPIKGVERVKGIEPSSEAWEAPALPLSYTRAPLMISDPRLPASALRRLAYSFVAGLGQAWPGHPRGMVCSVPVLVDARHKAGHKRKKL